MTTTEDRYGEEYPRIEGCKVLAVFEDHTGGGTARWFYAVHPNGNGLVAIESRKQAEYAPHSQTMRVSQRFADHEEARKRFINEVQRYMPMRSSVSA